MQPNDSNKNTAQFFAVGTLPDGSTRIVNCGNYDETLKCARELNCLHEFARSVHLLELLQSLRPDHPETLKELAYALLMNQQAESALAIVEKLSGLWPDRVVTWALQGMALKRIGRAADASQALDKALSLKATDMDAMRSVIMLCLILNEHLPQAELLAIKIQKEHPADPFAPLVLDHICQLKRNKAKTETAFKQAIEVTPNPQQHGAAWESLLRAKSMQVSDPKNN